MQGNPNEQEQESGRQRHSPSGEAGPEYRPGGPGGGKHQREALPVEDEQGYLFQEPSPVSSEARKKKDTESKPDEGLPPEAGGRMTSTPEEAPAAGEEQIPIPELTLPDEEDWGTRPFSRSERFGLPDTERDFADDTIQPGLNLPAVVGLILALFGILGGFWGVFFASLGLIFSATGVWAALRRDAGRLAVGVMGTAIALIFLAGHFIRML